MNVRVWRVRAVTTAVFFALVCVLSAGRAQASVFCAADVAFMTPWDYALDAPSAAASNLHYAYELEGDAAATVSGHLVLVTDTKSYRVAFDRTQLVQSKADPSSFISDGAFLTLPQAGTIKYAWVDDVTGDDGKTTTCPTYPYEIPVLSAQERADMTPPKPSGKTGPYRFDSAMAVFDSDLPPANCAQPYRSAEPLGEISKTTPYYDDLINKKPEVRGRVDIDSDGKVVNLEILQSSGSVALDQDAKETYGLRTYRPQLFRCTPVVSSYYFSLKYYHG